MFNRSSIEKLIVVRPGVAVPNPGDRLYNDSTSIFNQGAGGIGAYVDTAGSANPTALDPASYAGQPFRFIQVRDTSNDPQPLPQRVMEQSQYINGNCHKGLELAGEAYVAPSINSWLLGAPNTNSTGKVVISSQNEYVVQATANGWRTDMYNSVYNHPTVFGRFTSPNWSSTSISTENNRRDYTVKALARDFNRNANKGMNRHAIAVCIDTAGTTTTGPTIASIIAGGAGATVTIGYDSFCKPVNLLITEDRLQAFTDLEAKLTASVGNGGFNIGAGTAKLAIYALPENCEGVAGIEIAGDGSGEADLLYIMANDEQEAYYDEIMQTKKKIDVAFDLGAAFGTVEKKLVSVAREQGGSSRNLRIMYENTEHYRSYTSSKPWGANHVSYPDEILSGEVYDIYTVTHCANRSASSGLISQNEFLTMIAVVHTERTSSASTFSTGAVNPQKTYVESVLNAMANTYNVATISL